MTMLLKTTYGLKCLMIMSLLLIKVIFFSFVCVLTWSLLGVKKSLGHAQIGVL